MGLALLLSISDALINIQRFFFKKTNFFRFYNCCSSPLSVYIHVTNRELIIFNVSYDDINRRQFITIWYACL